MSSAACLPLATLKVETEIALPTGNKNRNRETNPSILISVLGTPVIWAAVASNILPREMPAKGFPCQEGKMQKMVSLSMVEHVVFSYFFSAFLLFL